MATKKVSRKKTTTSKTKRSVVVHKSSKPANDLYQVLAKVEESIQELSRMFVENGDPSHKGMRGMAKPTTSQIFIQKQLDAAQKRADTLLKILSKG